MMMIDDDNEDDESRQTRIFNKRRLKDWHLIL